MDKQLSCTIINLLFGSSKISKKFKIKESEKILYEILENFLDRRGRHRVYGIVKLVDKNLDDLARELVKDEKDNMEILNKVGEIKGLLLDISI